ncbi:malonate decarboxylase subunit epsilon [Bradyrhizobium neotropicale]|uniref:malonate decarboxylase subunit epsilon n=1 Tax=Bradyrhizobium neotropicale TaxID=1497615 RepID=UPI001AD75073|nr:malonate decarboxylase subunit epsilon [Bradyrhizobium neotropicale]MBO4227304.1 acyltransferase domain-containing protein [Bradyrhizobium neotropicale]
MTLAILCSGQGRQHRDMFALTGDAPEAARLFAHAAMLLGGRDPREIVRSASAEALHHNRIGQILCTLQALAAASVLRAQMPDRLIVAGYSVGEVAAWGVAGLMGMTDTLDLVARRAEAMDVATLPGDGMVFVRGLPRDAIDGLCERHEAEVAIVNPGDAFILGGSRTALNALADDAKAMNAARVVDVPVEVASHTRRLAKASAEFRDRLSHAAVTVLPTSGVRLLSGIDAAPVIDVQTGLDKLAAQISQTVQWADCLQACIESEATVFLELGPGRALSEMVAGAYRDVPTRSLDDFRTLDGVRGWVAAHVDR